MAIINLRLDTSNRDVMMFINDVKVDFLDVNMEKFTDTNGEDFVSFSYSVDSIQAGGLQERRRIFLPQPTDQSVANDLGLASEKVFNDEKAKQDVIKYLENTE